MHSNHKWYQGIKFLSVVRPASLFDKLINTCWEQSSNNPMVVLILVTSIGILFYNINDIFNILGYDCSFKSAKWDWSSGSSMILAGSMSNRTEQNDATRQCHNTKRHGCCRKGFLILLSMFYYFTDTCGRMDNLLCSCGRFVC